MVSIPGRCIGSFVRKMFLASCMGVPDVHSSFDGARQVDVVNAVKFDVHVILGIVRRKIIYSALGHYFIKDNNYDRL